LPTKLIKNIAGLFFKIIIYVKRINKRLLKKNNDKCLRVSDCSENPAKALALGHREQQSDRRKLLSATMSPIGTTCGVVA